MERGLFAERIDASLNPIRLIEIDNARHNVTPRMLIIAFAPFIAGGDVQFIARVLILSGFRGSVAVTIGGDADDAMNTASSKHR